MKSGAVVLSIDAKKKENTENFRNSGREYAQKGRGKQKSPRTSQIPENV
jgi:hypothetical protein